MHFSSNITRNLCPTEYFNRTTPLLGLLLLHCWYSSRGNTTPHLLRPTAFSTPPPCCVGGLSPPPLSPSWPAYLSSRFLLAVRSPSHGRGLSLDCLRPSLQSMRLFGVTLSVASLVHESLHNPIIDSSALSLGTRLPPLLESGDTERCAVFSQSNPRPPDYLAPPPPTSQQSNPRGAVISQARNESRKIWAPLAHGGFGALVATCLGGGLGVGYGAVRPVLSFFFHPR